MNQVPGIGEVDAERRQLRASSAYAVAVATILAGNGIPILYNHPPSPREPKFTEADHIHITKAEAKRLRKGARNIRNADRSRQGQRR